jgi:Ankyrin repeats (3 copies)
VWLRGRTALPGHVAVLLAIAAVSCVRPPATRPTSLPAPATLAAPTTSQDEDDPLPPSGSRVAPGIDTSPLQAGTTIPVRVRLLARENACDKYCWSRVKVLFQAIEDASHPRTDSEIRVASLSSGKGVPDGVSTIYLAPYNKNVPHGLWRLAEDANGVALVPTDAEVAQVWVKALLGDDRTWLPDHTMLPFVFRSTAPNHRCQRAIDSSLGLREWTACLYQGADPFVEGLLWTKRTVIPEGLESASRKLKKAARSIAGPGNWVHITGEVKAFHSTLLVRVVADGPRKLVSAAVGDVVIDAQGMAALKHRAERESLVRAINQGDAKKVRALIRQGAAVNDTEDDGLGGSVIFIAIAAAKGNLAIVDMLLEAGAEPNECCCACVTALHEAIQRGHTPIVTRLLEAGADPRKSYEGTVSTLDLAKRSGNPEIIRRIEEALARPPRAK